jgi:hypothetical protein
VTYTSPWPRAGAERRSALLYPVQAYAALGALLLAALAACCWLREAPAGRGDVAGVWLIGAGICSL